MFWSNHKDVMLFKQKIITYLRTRTRILFANDLSGLNQDYF